jgi:hypothetical protein
LIYNWWSLFMRLAIPERHAEAITSRPLMLHAIGKQTTHAGQTRVTITSMHAEAKRIQKVLTQLTSFLRSIQENAEQLDWCAKWRLILSRTFVWFLGGRPLRGPTLLPESTL